MIPRILRPLSAALLLALTQGCIIYVQEDGKHCDERWDDDCEDRDDWHDGVDDDWDDDWDGDRREECEGIEEFYEVHADALHARADECWGDGWDGDDDGDDDDAWREECFAVLWEADALAQELGMSVEELWWMMLEQGPDAVHERLVAIGLELPEEHLWLIFECYEVFGPEWEAEHGDDGAPDDECEAVSLDAPWPMDCDELAEYFAALEDCWEG